MSSRNNPDSYGEPSGPASTAWARRGGSERRPARGRDGVCASSAHPRGLRASAAPRRRKRQRARCTPASSSVSFDSLGHTDTPGGGSRSSMASSLFRRAACAIAPVERAGKIQKNQRVVLFPPLRPAAQHVHREQARKERVPSSDAVPHSTSGLCTYRPRRAPHRAHTAAAPGRLAARARCGAG